MAILPVGIGPQEGGYQIERSLRFNSADSAYLSRTPASAGNKKTFTISLWIKRSALGATTALLDGDSSDGNRGEIYFDSSDRLNIYDFYVASGGLQIFSQRVFRDVGAWMHIVIAFDTTQATDSNRLKIYVNGVQENLANWSVGSGASRYPTQNADFSWNGTTSHWIGRTNSGSAYFNGYLSEIYNIDGQALDPTSFGEYNSETGVWQPKAYTGSYGTNGFYLDFADNSSTTALGYDAAGSNDWTPNNFSVTAGAGNDSLVDTPTNYGTDTGVGGEVRGNYATLNPLWRLGGSGYITPTNGNLQASIAATNNIISSTMPIPSTGKWYVEFELTTGQFAEYGLCNESATGGGNANNIFGAYYNGSNLWFANGSNGSSDGNQANTTGDVGLIAVDVDANKLWIGRNRSGTITWMGGGNPATGSSPSFSASGGGGVYSTAFDAQTFRWPFVASGAGADVWNVNFGQRPFAYAAPSGFKALCTTNLPDPAIADGSTAMNVVTYTGNATNRSIDVGMAPDFTWIKHRSSAENHNLYDILRGAGYRLESNSTDSQTYYADRLTAFTSTGFDLGTGYNNTNGTTYVAWNWKANGAGVSNTAGTITSTVSANTTAGFSIVTYTGNGTNGATIGHGLGVTPSMIIVKSRGTTDSWGVYHTSIGNTKGLYLETTGAAVTSSAFWNNTSPTSTVFSVSNNSINNASSTNYVAYAFAPVEGYSAFGSYTGNGSADGPMIFTGFKPAFVMFKRTNSTGSWWMSDSSRSPYNEVGERLWADSSGAEYDYDWVDFTSNGFKLRDTETEINGSGSTFIYAAFAENPFKYSLAR